MIYIHRDHIEKLTKNLPGAATEIDFSHISGVGAECVEEMAEILQVNKTVVKYIVGHNNKLNDSSLQKLSMALCVNTTLEVLNLRGHKMNDESMRILAAMLSVNHTITELSLGKYGVCIEGFRLLADVLRVNRGIKVIKLSGNEVEPEAIRILVESLKENVTLAELDFAGMQITKQSAIYFADILQTNKTLKKLILSNCRLENEDAKELAKGLAKNNTLTELNLRGNGIAPDGAEALAKALDGNNTMTTLNLSLNPIGGKGAEAFGKMLSGNQGLTTLNLMYCGIDDAGGAALCKGLTENKHLKKLILENNKLSDRTGKTLGEALAVNKTLLILNLKSNEIKIQGGIGLAVGLGRNQTIVELNLSKNQVGDAGFAAGLKNNRTLVRLNLYQNQFSSEAIVALANAIKDHPRLVSLDLQDNQAGDDGAMAFAQTLADKNGHSILAHLDLNGNGITKKSVKVLAQFISHNQHMAYLRIASNHFGIQDLRTLAMALVLNQTLRSVDLGSCAQTIKNQEVVAAFVAATDNSTLTNFNYPSDKIDWRISWAIRDVLISKQAKELALHDAVCNKDVKTAKKLLDEGVSPYFCTNIDAKKVGLIVLPDFTSAADRNSIVLPYAHQSDETLLSIAVRQQDLPMLQLLLKHKMAAALSSVPNQEDETAVQLAKKLENPVFYQAFVDAQLVSEKRAAKEQPAEDLPAAKRARTVRTRNADAPLPGNNAQQTPNTERPARNLRTRHK